jgi:hypothetical protein
MYEKDGIVYAGNPAPILKVRTIRALSNYHIRLEFSTGETGEFDFSPLLALPAFQPLRDKTLFDHVYLERGIPSWDGGNIDIAPEALYDSCRFDPPGNSCLTPEEEAVIA